MFVSSVQVFQVINLSTHHESRVKAGINHIRSSVRRGADKEGRESIDPRGSRPCGWEGRQHSHEVDMHTDCAKVHQSDYLGHLVDL